MTKPYVPQVGHRVKVEVVGTFIKDFGNGWLSLCQDNGNDLYLPSTETWTRLPDLEPEWQPGDIVIDACGVVYKCTPCLDPWWDGYDWRSNDTPVRPLTRFVRETRP